MKVWWRVRVCKIKSFSEIKYPVLNFRGCSEGIGDALPGFALILNASGSKGKSVTPFYFFSCSDWFSHDCSAVQEKEKAWRFQASIHIVHLCTASFHKRPSAANHPSSAQAGRESNTTSPFHSKPTAQVPRCRDSNSFNTLIGQKTAKTRTTNSHQKLSQYSWSHMGVHSTQLIAPRYF